MGSPLTRIRTAGIVEKIMSGESFFSFSELALSCSPSFREVKISYSDKVSSHWGSSFSMYLLICDFCLFRLKFVGEHECQVMSLSVHRDQLNTLYTRLPNKECITFGFKNNGRRLLWYHGRNSISGWKITIYHFGVYFLRPIADAFSLEQI
jgi:hypothetical protein